MQVLRSAYRSCLSYRPQAATCKPPAFPSDQRLPRSKSGTSLLSAASSENAACSFQSDALRTEASLLGESLSGKPERSSQKPHDDASQEAVPRTLSEALWVFVRSGAPLFTLVVLLLSLCWRSQAAFSVADVWVAGATAAFWLVQEYVLHAKLLHSTIPWFGRDIHDGHHAKEYFHVSIESFPLVVAIAFLATGLSIWPMGGGPLARTFLASYIAMGLTYQWTHYLVHTHVPARNPVYRTIRHNHMRHHCRNEGFWFAFCLPVLDDVCGTAPSVSTVPVSDLVRRLKHRAGQPQPL